MLVPTRPPGWEIDFDALARAVTPRTRAIVVCTPANPCGKVWSEAELDRLAALAEARDLIVVTDEIYEHILFDVATWPRPLRHPARGGRDMRAPFSISRLLEDVRH